MPDQPFQVCVRCNKSLPLSRDFFGHVKATGKHRSICRKCESLRVSAFKRKNRDVDNRLSKERQERLGNWKPTTELKDFLFDEQDGFCALCGGKIIEREKAQVEHLRSTIKGGGNELENLVLAHPKCNQEKHGKTFSEYVTWREKVGLPRSTFCNAKILSAMLE